MKCPVGVCKGFVMSLVNILLIMNLRERESYFSSVSLSDLATTWCSMLTGPGPQAGYSRRWYAKSRAVVKARR